MTPEQSPLAEQCADAIYRHYSDDLFIENCQHIVGLVLRIARPAILDDACNAIARIDRATLSLHAGEFKMDEWRSAKAALSVAEGKVRALLPGPSPEDLT